MTEQNSAAPGAPAARATLATVQPGGRVRLGHHHGGEQAVPAAGGRDAWEQLRRELAIDGMPADKQRLARAAFDAASSAVQAERERWFTRAGEYLKRAQAAESALAARPSPAGQGDALALAEHITDHLCRNEYDIGGRPELLACVMEALAARQPVAEQHPDDLAVDAFAAAMRAKMADARAKGRGGWEDPAQCTADDLSRMLRDHVDKGDPRDVANFCMMLHQRGEAIAARQPVGQEPMCSGGFVIGNGSGEKYMAWGQVGPEWTADRSAALWLVRRADAEALAAENEDAWLILPVERCALPPNGWECTLAAGHEGPCPTVAATPAQAVGNAIDMGYWGGPHIGLMLNKDWPAHSGRVYLGAPAQAVDLGQCWEDAFARLIDKRKANKRDSFLLKFLRSEVQALIDGKAVGNG